MWIALVGDPSTRFTVCGPFKMEDCDGARGESARAIYGGSDWWETELKPLAEFEGYDPEGDAVVFGGAIHDGPWIFYGPFHDTEAARKLGRDGWARARRHRAKACGRERARCMSTWRVATKV
jgi:hypothetical protein